MVCVIKQWITWKILEINKKDYLKWASKPRFMSQKTLDNDLVTTRKSKVTLKLNKPAYVGMCLLQLVLMHKSHHDYIKNIYGNKARLLFTDADILIHEIKNWSCLWRFFRRIKKCLIFKILTQLSQNIMMNQTD